MESSLPTHKNKEGKVSNANIDAELMYSRFHFNVILIHKANVSLNVHVLIPSATAVSLLKLRLYGVCLKILAVLEHSDHY